MNPLVIYHGNCFDGFSAAWVARKVFGEDAEYRPTNYGDPFPSSAAGRDVFIIDISWPRDVLVAWREKANLIVLDHHKTAQAALEGLSFCTFDMDRSGCQIAWDHFFPSQPRPRLIDYAGDRDLWRFKLPFSREINAWMHTYEFDFQAYDGLAKALDHDLEGVADIGSDLLRYEERLVNQMCAQVVFQNIGGHDVPVVNASVLFSEVGERLCQLHPEAPFAAYWFNRGDRQQQWGLRSKGGFDVSEVAKLYGGGGHAAAAGFQVFIGY